jgi:membrane dipeptidase
MKAFRLIPCFLASLCGVALLSLASAQTPVDPDLAARAAALHRRLFTIDTHLDTPTVQMSRPDWDFGQRHAWPTDLSQCDLPRMREGGLAAAFFAIWLEANLPLLGLGSIVNTRGRCRV